MRGWSTGRRRGLGATVAFVAWVVTIALIYALITGTSQSGALTGVIRIGSLRMVMLAAQSALAEASFVLRHPPAGGSTVLRAMHDGRDAGEAHVPEGTRALYADEVQAGRLQIDPVQYKVVSRTPIDKPDVWLIDLTVRAHYSLAGSKFTRQLRRRFLGRICQVEETLGPSAGKVVLTTLAVQGEPLFEVSEP